jgi:putative endonuclease
MFKHKETGIKGEQIAVNFLINNNYAILFRNWRFGKKEVDIIAHKGDTLVFIEVKTRRSFDFGFPEEAVNTQKQSFLKLAAEAFMEANPQYIQLRFDIISILLEANNTKEILHFEDAFF